jgi:alpha-N-arabinofuranosidase
MNKPLFFRKAFLQVGFFTALLSQVSCESTKKTVVENQLNNNKNSTAYFDSFTYRGNDDFYKNNPLPAKDYFYNPILPGWYSDPSICKNGEDYFLVTSTFSYFPGVPIFHSKDLVNWKQIGHVLDRPEQLKLDEQKVSEGIFAPAMSYNPHNKTYYMITTNIGGGNFFVKTKNPFDSWSNPVWLPEVQGIDPSFFFDDDGKAYIVNNDEPIGGSQYDGHRSIRIQRFDTEQDKVFGPREMLVNGGVNLAEKPIWIEGPHLYKINGKYFLMCAEGGTSVNHREVIFRSDSPMGKFIPSENNPILTQKHLDPKRIDPVTCAGHADLVQKTNGEWWSVFLACRPIENDFENLGRETFLMPVKWDKNGFPFMTKGEEVVPGIVHMPGLERSKDVTFGNFSETDDFNSPTLKSKWMTLRGTASELYSLTDKKGYLSLKCTDVLSTERKVPAFVSRRMQHHKFECETEMYFEPSNSQESAGFLLFKDETHQYSFTVSKSGENKIISVQKISNSIPEIIGRKKISSKQKTIKLKVVSTGKFFEFYYGADKENWTAVAKNVDAKYLSTATSYGFTGTNIGLYATAKTAFPINQKSVTNF